MSLPAATPPNGGKLSYKTHEELGAVLLQPGSGGVFDVHLAGELLWSRQTTGRFPDIKELKQAVRDRIAPERPLGHSDREPRG
jgi:selenoprotein W-related protein